MQWLWGPAALVVGALVGYLHRGREDTQAILRRGLLLGLFFAVLIAALGLIAGEGAFGVAGAAGALLSVILLTGLFLLGVWIGDLLESRFRGT